MKKNTAKLNEAALNKIVTESVKKVISELDWKTASRAADIQSKWKYNGRKGGDERYFTFRNYSDDAANRKFFGQEGGVDFLPNDTTSYPNWVGFQNGYPEVNVYDGKNWVGRILPTCAWHPTRDPFGTICVFDKQCAEGSTIANPITPEEIKNIFGDEVKLYQRFMDAVKEYTDFKHYKYAYDNENGWHLKESKNNQYICRKKVRLTEGELRKIVAESVKKVLSEIENINQKPYTLQQALETRQKNINQKYYTKQQAIEMGYVPAEYQDSSKPFELWHDPGVGGATIRVERGEPTFSKSGFNIC